MPNWDEGYYRVSIRGFDYYIPCYINPSKEEIQKRKEIKILKEKYPLFFLKPGIVEESE